jgi:hypothetical protein
MNEAHLDYSTLISFNRLAMVRTKDDALPKKVLR